MAVRRARDPLTDISKIQYGLVLGTLAWLVGLRAGEADGAAGTRPRVGNLTSVHPRTHHLDPERFGRAEACRLHRRVHARQHADREAGGG